MLPLVSDKTGNTDRRKFLGLLVTGVIAAAISPASLFADTTSWTDSWGRDGAGAALPEMESPAGGNSVASPLKNASDIRGDFCEGKLRLRSAIHGEAYEFRFRDTKGNYDKNVVASLNWFLRCRDKTWQYMDVPAIETLNYLSKMLGDPIIQINSAYRSPNYNAKIAAHNENVARNSLHQYGRAIDFSIPGIPVREVCSYTLYARDVMGYGGVGYYPSPGFVHLDSGTKKQWRK